MRFIDTNMLFQIARMGGWMDGWMDGWMGQDGMGRERTGRDGMGWDRTGQDKMGRDGTGSFMPHISTASAMCNARVMDME